jgi:hypothetical protein
MGGTAGYKWIIHVQGPSKQTLVQFDTVVSGDILIQILIKKKTSLNLHFCLLRLKDNNQSRGVELKCSTCPIHTQNQLPVGQVDFTS